MEVSIIKIGNSKGFRLTKTILDKYQIKDKVELIMEEDQIVLRPIVEPRKDWDKAFKEMHEKGDDQLLMNDVFEDENFDERDQMYKSVVKVKNKIINNRKKTLM
jgi:antitoxin MazE